MTDPYYSDDTLSLLLGDARNVLATMDMGSVNCVVTSPPYFGLRDYEGHGDQIGSESSPARYVAALAEVFAGARRVLADDGTLWLNLGDCYYSGRGNPGPNSADEKQPARRGWTRPLDRSGQDWAKPKDLLGIPWRVAFALQDAGWYLRNAIVWHKPNAMPESVRDRLAGRHEMLFLLTKSRRYWFDLDAIREPHAESTIAAAHRARRPYEAPGQRPNTKSRPLGDKGANPGDVWSINTRPLTEAHFATFPVELPRPCIAAGCRPGGTVLDPFSGAGTTALAAQQLGRRAIGIDINAKYHNIALKRMSDAPLPFGEAS
ncbi:MAG: site-specific DNA-methyltransferase [Actinophytocola sp.]|uniref:DNA-methyltransferase n=1 Tax=Actinophytocola sp. TaxID=1872138 RepID=UPI003C78931D